MKKLSFVILSLVVLSSCANRLTKRQIVFDFKYTEDYCGGAYPDEEILKELATPKDFTKKLYLTDNPKREGANFELNFDNKGLAKRSGFAVGTYYLYMAPKLNIDSVMMAFEKIAEPEPQPIVIGEEESEPQPIEMLINPRCVLKQNYTPIATFEVKKSTRKLQDTLKIVCDPCLPPKP